MRYILCFIMMVCSLLCNATICRYIVGDNEKNDRKVYQIRKDASGYMWFLTHTGINRYDGTQLKYYELQSCGKFEYFHVGSYQLYTDSKQGLWVVSRTGCVWAYNARLDKFELAVDLRKQATAPIDFLSLDSRDNIWFTAGQKMFAYHLPTKAIHPVKHPFSKLSGWIEATPGTYFLSSERGLFSVSLSNYTLVKLSSELSGGRCKLISKFLYQAESRKLVLADCTGGICVYDCEHDQMMVLPKNQLKGSKVNCLRTFKDKAVLIATDGAGVYHLNMADYQMTEYLSADFENGHSVRTNRIADLFVDEQSRVWVADYPEGVTLLDPEGTNGCKWYKHEAGNKQSLLNNRVNAVLKDSGGDIWFATDDGICRFHPRTGQWHEISSDFPCRIYTSLCELSPGEIYATNYAYGLGRIQKDNIIEVPCHTDLPSVNAVAVKDRDHIWLGTNSGLYVLNIRSGEKDTIRLSVSEPHIRTLLQTKDGVLYIGTERNGLLSYDPERKMTQLYGDGQLQNIEAILSGDNHYLLVSTDQAIFRFHLGKKRFSRFTNQINRMTSGISLGEDRFLFGTLRGVVEFDKQKVNLSQRDGTLLYLDDLIIANQKMNTETAGTPLRQALNYTSTLWLNHHQESFSFIVTSVNYDSSTDILYTWKLDDSEWSVPTNQNLVTFSDLSAGTHLFSVRALSAENGNPLSQRILRIVIRPPLWKSEEAFICYGILLVLFGVLVICVFYIWRERNLSREKIRIFMDTVRNLCLPVALIKSPLENLYAKSSSETLRNVLRQIERVGELLNRLENIGRISPNPDHLLLTENELVTFLRKIAGRMEVLAREKNISICWKSTPNLMSVWLDKDKITSILESLMTMMIENSGEGGEIGLTVSCTSSSWMLELESDENGFLKKHTRSHRTNTSKASLNTMGWLLIQELIRLHKGRFTLSHKKKGKSSIILTFPIVIKQLPGTSGLPEEFRPSRSLVAIDNVPATKELLLEKSVPTPIVKEKYFVGLVERNEELRAYMTQVLSEDYRLVTVSDGKELLEMTLRQNLDIILVNSVLPGISGEELCDRIKSDENTAHIPVILLVESIVRVDTFHEMVDRYISMPLDISLLKAEINRLIANRRIVRKRYMKLAFGVDADMYRRYEEELSDKDQAFITKVQQLIEDNLTTSNFDVGALSKSMNMSRTSFSNRIKAITQQAPAHYMQTVRLNRAVILLVAKHSVGEVADLTGFSDSKYFSEVFKKYYGDSPTKYVSKL